MKLAFYSLTGWSIGKIEREVSAYFPEDWRVKWFDFRECHDPELFHELLDEDYHFVSPGYAATVLMKDYSIPAERIFYIVYDENEFERTIQTLRMEGLDIHTMFDAFYGYGVFSDLLRNISIARGVHRIPSVLGLGLNVNDYTYRSRETLEVLGYAQKWERKDTPQGLDIKRGPLAQAVADRVGLELRRTNLEIVGESGGPELNDWYQSVDLILVPSLIEGGPLAPFEAAACGIPTIGTPVGTFMWFCAMGGGIVVDPRPSFFIEDATAVVNHLKENPAHYQELCEAAYDKVKWYDWSYQHDGWLEFFTRD